MNALAAAACLVTILAAVGLPGGSAAALAMANGEGPEPGADATLPLGRWVKFVWNTLGSEVMGGPWTYAADLPTILRVTDVSCYGDRFRVSENGAELGTTTPPGSTNCGGPEGADDGYADPPMSSGCWLVPTPGAHTIDIALAENPHHFGGAFLRADLLVTDPVATADCPVHALLHAQGIASPP